MGFGLNFEMVASQLKDYTQSWVMSQSVENLYSL